MSFQYITIEREYGSGGTKIARRVAEKCGISCFGEEILEAVSKKLDIPVEQIQKYEESVTNSLLYTVFMMSRAQEGNADMLSKEGHIFVEEQQEIKNLAASGPAIFIGHCASEALKKEPCVLRVFIRADEETKINRAVSEYGIDEKNAGAVCRKFNKKRANYYAFNTSKKWDDFSNYDIVLDSSRLGIDGCANVLAALFEK